MQNLKIWLMDERLNVVERSNINFAPVIKVLWSVDKREERYPFLVGVDPYGHTIFNVHQVPRVIKELEDLKLEKKSVKILNEIEATIVFLKKIEQHKFINFIGD